MLSINQKMKLDLLKINSLNQELEPALAAIVVQGFIKRDNCYLLRESALNNKHISLVELGDEISYECFINSLYINDFVSKKTQEQSIIFIQEVFKEWDKANPELALVAILAEDNGFYKVKFHLFRENMSLFSGSLEEYEQPLLIVDSNTFSIDLLIKD